MSDLTTKLSEVFWYVYNNPHSTFYKDFYGSIDLQSNEQLSMDFWESLPVLTKKDIERVPLFERTFVTPESCEMLRASSGTSGAAPIFTLRNYGYNFDSLFAIVRPKGALIVANYSYLAEQVYREANGAVQVIHSDLQNLETAVKMMVGTPVNYLDVWVHAIDLLIPLLEKYGVLEQIDVLIYFGERMSPGQYKKIRNVFKDVHFYETYSNSESHDSTNFTGLDSYQSETGSVLSVGQNVYPELLDLQTGEIVRESGKVGELVTTVLHTEGSPFPALRYKNGDVAQYHTYDTEFTKRTLVIEGRKDLSYIKITGGQLQLPEFQRVVANFSDMVDSYFELHYTPDTQGGLPRVALHVCPTQSFKPSVFIEAFMSHVRVSPTKTYADGVAEGLYAPMVCVQDPELQGKEGKGVYFYITQ